MVKKGKSVMRGVVSVKRGTLFTKRAREKLEEEHEDVNGEEAPTKSAREGLDPVKRKRKRSTRICSRLRRRCPGSPVSLITAENGGRDGEFKMSFSLEQERSASRRCWNPLSESTTRARLRTSSRHART